MSGVDECDMLWDLPLQFLLFINALKLAVVLKVLLGKVDLTLHLGVFQDVYGFYQASKLGLRHILDVCQIDQLDARDVFDEGENLLQRPH